MQKDNKFLDDLARMATGAAGSLLDVKRELEGYVSAQLEKTLVKMKLVTREEHETTQAMLAKAREEQEELKERLQKIEEKLNP